MWRKVSTGRAPPVARRRGGDRAATLQHDAHSRSEQDIRTIWELLGREPWVWSPLDSEGMVRWR